MKPGDLIVSLAFSALSAADINFEWLSNRALNMAVFQAAAPAEDERAPFVGIGHDLSPMHRGHYLA